METLKKSDVQHKALIVIVNKNWNGRDYSRLYEATNFAWKVRMPRVEKVEIVLASYYRRIVGVFVVDEWLEANAENFPGRSQAVRSSRCGYRGREADPDIQNLYVGRWVSDELRGHGGGCRYVNC